MGRIILEVRKNILDDWCKLKNMTFRKLAKKYKVSPSGVHKLIKKFGETTVLQDLPKSGRKRGTWDSALEKKVMRMFLQKPSLSVRDAAKKANTSPSTIQRIKLRCNLKTYKKQKQPKRDDKQTAAVRKRTRKLYDRVLTKKSLCIVMDDETYCKFDFKTLPGSQFITVPASKNVSQKDKSICVEKFGKKILVWQAICQCGLRSKAFFTTENLNAELYRKECLQKRLLPIIRKHRIPTLFWPDLASCHYSKATLEWYKANKVDVVEKDMNPPNCPEVRPIERYWAIMKRHLQKNVKAATSVNDFKKKWNRASDKVTDLVVQNLMKNIKKKVRLQAK